MEKRFPFEHPNLPRFSIKTPFHPQLSKSLQLSSIESSAQPSPNQKLLKTSEIKRSTHTKKTNRSVLLQEEDSDFQFSIEIMKFNPHNKTREVKEKERLVQLIEFDWLCKTSCTLRLPKDVYYVAVNILRRFIILKPKTNGPPLTLANIRLYDLAALSLASKMENLAGGFLGAGKNLLTAEGPSIPKDKVFQYQVQIAKTLKYCIPNKSYITECLVSLAWDWNDFADYKRQTYKLIEFDLTETIIKEFPQEPEIPYFRILLYLVDSVVMRSIGSIPFKQLSKLDTHEWYQRIILSVIFHLQFSSYPEKSKRRMQMIMKEFMETISPRLQYEETMFKQSHFINKKINKILSYFQVYQNEKGEEVPFMDRLLTTASFDQKGMQDEGSAPRLQKGKMSNAQLWEYLQQKKCFPIENLKIKVLIDNQPYIPLYSTDYKDLIKLFGERPCLFI